MINAANAPKSEPRIVAVNKTAHVVGAFPRNVRCSGHHSTTKRAGECGAPGWLGNPLELRPFPKQIPTTQEPPDWQ